MPNMGNRNHGCSIPVATLMPRHPADTAAQLANWPRTFWMIRGSPVSGTGISLWRSRLRGAAGRRGGYPPGGWAAGSGRSSRPPRGPAVSLRKRSGRLAPSFHCPAAPPPRCPAEEPRCRTCTPVGSYPALVRLSNARRRASAVGQRFSGIFLQTTSHRQRQVFRNIRTLPAQVGRGLGDLLH